MEFLGVGIQSVGAEENGQIADQMTDYEKDQQDAGDGDDCFLSYGRKNPQVRGAGTGTSGGGG